MFQENAGKSCENCSKTGLIGTFWDTNDGGRTSGNNSNPATRTKNPLKSVWFQGIFAIFCREMRRIEQNGFFSASALFTFAVRSKIYITSFLIYANRTLDPGLCTGFQRTPYMDLLPDCFRKAPFYNKRLAMELTPEPEEAVRAIHSVTYYRLSE